MLKLRSQDRTGTSSPGDVYQGAAGESKKTVALRVSAQAMAGVLAYLQLPQLS